jgi:DNA-binding transcriptional LysR family regulator
MNTDRITLQRLRLFTEVARLRNLSAASEDLRVSQPSISVQIRILEKEFGVKLWKKNGHGIELTPAGTLLVRRARRILRTVEAARLRLSREFPDTVSPLLRIGGSQMASMAFLPTVLRLFKKDHPDVRINLRTKDGVELTEMLLAGEIDLALVNGSPDHRQIIKEPFGRDTIIACVSGNHPLAKKPVLTQADMDRFGFITRRLDDMGRSEKFLDELKARGFNPRVAIEADSSASKRAAVLNQLGIALMFKAMIEHDLASGELVELEVPGGKLYGKRSLIYHKSRALPPPAKEFLALLRNQAPKAEIERSRLPAALPIRDSNSARSVNRAPVHSRVPASLPR